MSPEQQATEFVKASPAITLTGMHFFGYPIADWLALAGTIYTVALFLVFVRNLITARRVGDQECAARCPTVQRLKAGGGGEA